MHRSPGCSAPAERIGVLTGIHPNGTVALLNRAARENDRRHYTASARLYAQAECVQWDDEVQS
jgi:hypothetical protein